MDTKAKKITIWVLQIVAAVILLQSLFFKFTGAPEAVQIFTTLGVEPYGRIGLGVLELIAGVMLLVPATAALGSLAAAGIVSGAIVSHLTVLGIRLEGAGMDDGGTLFIMALIVWVASLVVAFLRRQELMAMAHRLGIAGRA